MTSPVSSSSSTTTSSSLAAGSQQPPNGVWPSAAPYVVPPIAASAAIVPVFRDMVAKSAQQKGQPVPPMTHLEGMKKGLKAAPTVGIIIGTQMVIQSLVERALVGESNAGSLSSILASSAIVGFGSAPILAVFNGQTMGWTVRESLRRFTLLQGLAITVQETAFLGGLSAADRLALAMRRRFGNNRVVDYIAAFVAGATGSFAGHSADSALTRWQCGMRVDSFGPLMWGSIRKARAIGGFSVLYKLVKEIMSLTLPPSHK